MMLHYNMTTGSQCRSEVECLALFLIHYHHTTALPTLTPHPTPFPHLSSGMMVEVRVTIPCTLTRVSMSSGFRSRMVRELSRLNGRT
jgi:hypothetical protein